MNLYACLVTVKAKKWSKIPLWFELLIVVAHPVDDSSQTLFLWRAASGFNC